MSKKTKEKEVTVRLNKKCLANQNTIGKVLDSTNNLLQNALKDYAVSRVKEASLKTWFLKSASKHAEEIAYHTHWNDVLYAPKIAAAGGKKTDEGRKLDTQRRSYYGRCRMYAATYALNTKAIRSKMTPAQVEDANNVIATYEDTKTKARKGGKVKKFAQKYDDALKRLYNLLEENAKGRAEYITAKKTIARLCEARNIDLD
jgi:hypothetical protein